MNVRSGLSHSQFEKWYLKVLCITSLIQNLTPSHLCGFIAYRPVQPVSGLLSPSNTLKISIHCLYL